MAGKLTSKQRRYLKRKTKVHELDVSELDEELNIVPFLDIVVNLIMFLLMTITSVAFFAQLEATLPSLGSSRGTRGAERPLDLKVHISTEGVIVAGSRGKLAPGCRDTAPGRVFAVPRTADGYDFEALGACAANVHAAFPTERRVTLSADPDVHYEHVIHAMDALRGAEGAELFPEVLLSAGIR
ncbi:MAG: biopolymer transporter ExbD [Polyangiaceae bacterium]|nr:biopolymer transporter ExbD [Polyangiaceae bacterium]